MSTRRWPATGSLSCSPMPRARGGSWCRAGCSVHEGRVAGVAFVRILRRRCRHAEAFAGPGTKVELSAALAAKRAPAVARRKDAVAAALWASDDAVLRGFAAHAQRVNSKPVSSAASLRRPSSS
mmetsp:Transcript_20611/g.38481  ORF Transcript_20611/g.38481 Transcript_20611/m.38481 type:complete len:124 (-) Transcript_20611:1055-1426(-)